MYISRYHLLYINIIAIISPFFSLYYTYQADTSFKSLKHIVYLFALASEFLFEIHHGVFRVSTWLKI